ncbi:caspase family protein [Variovorax sp. PBL-E5]|uniref:caspase family protein n=1 Tax=Variovorax sp. PBL-E5 TaxID=434014 RepID=UPI0013A555B1|nr:caspase family protein [Variovorax sp. PBL-E5]
MSRTLRLVLLLLMAGAAASAGAVQRALLVGVSELVNQPPALWLQAPRNDVLLMRQALLRRGFAAADITVLADGVDGAQLPDAQRIHDALARLVAQSRRGDFVLLYFSGHGTRLRNVVKTYQEPDGLAENFLARDVRGTIGTDAVLSGGVRDVDFDAWIGALLARDVFVWSVFDTCSATSMTRGLRDALPVAEGPPDDEVRFRGIRVDQLARGAAAAPAPAAPSGETGMPRARYVAFFASESHQVTPELKLPRKDRTARPQGLLTWAVAEALQRQPATWRELFNDVLALYPPVIEELAARFPTRELPSPVAEGNLDLALFANSLAPLSTRPVWPAQRAGDRLAIDAGQLDGLEAGQAVRVLATRDDGTVRSADARLAQVEAGRTQLDVPADLAALPGSVDWSLTPQDEPASVMLRVAAARGLPEGLALRYPSAIRRVREGEGEGEPDVRWTELAGGGHRLDVVSPGLAALLGPQARGGAPIADLPGLRRRLEALAQLKWLLRLNALAQGGQLDGFEAVLEVWNGPRLARSGAAQSAEPIAAPAAGERMALHVRNTSGRSLDLVIVGIDAEGGLHPVFPRDDGETNRFERGAPDAPAAKRFELPWLGAGGSRLLVLAAPAAPWSAPRLFGVGPTEAMPDLRVRGLPRPERQRQVYAAMPGWPADAPLSK